MVTQAISGLVVCFYIFNLAIENIILQLSAFSVSQKVILQYELDAAHKLLQEKQTSLKETQLKLEEYKMRLHRIINHFILGPIIHIWVRLFNPNLLYKKQ